MSLQGKLSKRMAGAAALSAAGLLAAGTLSIGTATSRGTFLLDRAEVPGNGTLFDGSHVKTTNSSSLMYLSGGAQVLLASNSQASVFRSKLVLEQGSSEVGKTNSYDIEALGLHVAPAENSGQVRVTVKTANVVEVASLNGPVNVVGADGFPVAHLSPGRVMDIGLQTGAGNGNGNKKKKAAAAAEAGAPVAMASYRGVLFLTLLSTAAAGGAVAAVLETNGHSTSVDGQ